jgi:electron transfer flavoprotein alpha subunit
MANILVVAEQRDNKIKSISYEVATYAKTLGEVSGLVIGSAVSEEAKSLGKYGISNVSIVENADLANYSPDAYASAVTDVVNANNIDIILMGATSMGKDLAAHVGAKLGAGVAQDCIAINEDLTARRPMYAGKMIGTVKLTTDKKVYTIRANTAKAEESSINATVTAQEFTANAKVMVKELLVAANKKIDVAEANIIVTGGRGMGGPENWGLIENAAEILGAATGASRAVVDAGWRPHAEQVGQTGKVVSPSLYIACGVSGAIQHLAGMKTSKFIVAINKDPEAPIFKVADYGIVGDVMVVLPVLAEELKKVMA